jgi:hypothetical protein
VALLGNPNSHISTDCAGTYNTYFHFALFLIIHVPLKLPLLLTPLTYIHVGNPCPCYALRVLPLGEG